MNSSGTATTSASTAGTEESQQQQQHAQPTTKSLTLQATPKMCHHCFDILIHELLPKHLRHFVQPKPPKFISDLPDTSVQSPLFVTWDKTTHKFKYNNHNHNNNNNNNNNNMHHANTAAAAASAYSVATPPPHSYQLRGCIGTLGPRKIVDAVGEYAIIAALKDRRFRPITLTELPLLRVSVSLLVQYESCQDAYDWIVGVHGIIITFTPPPPLASSSSNTISSTTTTTKQQQYSATYLPEVAKEQGWTVQQAVASLVQKAGYYGSFTKELFESIQCTRYQSSKYKVSYNDYVLQHCQGTDPLQQAMNVMSTSNTTTTTTSGQSAKHNSTCQQM